MKLRYRNMMLFTLSLALIYSPFEKSIAVANSGVNVSPTAMMGEETIGNKPFHDANYKDWPNVLAVVNNKSRVYHTWFNGDERFYFDANSEQLNQVLTDFAKLKGKKEVLVLPQAEDVRSFDQTKSFEFNCQLHLVGGIAKHIAGKPKGDTYWSLDPRLTIHVTPKTDLKAIKVPKGVRLVGLEELKARYKDGLQSTDKNVRGWGIGFYVNIDPFDGESLKVVSDLTVDTDDWVALNALANIAKFGPKVEDHLPRLMQVAKSPIKQNSERAQKLIPIIQAAAKEKAKLAFTKRETTFRKQADMAQAFVDRINGI